jgi:3-hydroxybutyryl-CoA dehydrogenase
MMGHAGTDPEIFERVVQFASEIGMIPIPIHKETKWIYIEFFVGSITYCSARIIFGVSDVESIDKTWMITMGTKWGLWYSGQDRDANGLQCKYALGTKLKKRLDRAAIIKSDFIDKGKMG